MGVARLRDGFQQHLPPQILILAMVLASCPKLNAGAWTEEAGHGQIIFTCSYLQTPNEFDASGKIRPFGYRGHFRQVSLNPYFEFGLTRHYTLVLNLNAPLLKYSNQYGAESSAGLGDVEVGIRRRLNSTESHWIASGQLTAQFAAYPADRNPAPGNHQQDVEGRLLLGRGGIWGGHNAFFDIEAAYRYRSGAPADQFRGDFSTGFDVTPRFMALAQMFSIKSLRNGDPFSPTNPNAQSDFDLYKAQLSLVVRVARGTRLQMGWNDAFAGRNTGGGQTWLAGVWKNF